MYPYGYSRERLTDLTELASLEARSPVADQPRLLDLPRWASAHDFSCPGGRNRRPSHDLARPGWLDGVAQALLGSILDAKTLCFFGVLVVLTRLLVT